MVLEKSVFIDEADDIASRDEGADPEVFVGLEAPVPVLVQAWQFDTSGDEDTLGDIGNFCKRSLNSVENSLQYTWSELHRQWAASSQDWITGGQSRGILVALDGRGVTLKFDDFSDQLVPADLDELVHFCSRHVFADDH
jgi:hypothetical protein